MDILESKQPINADSELYEYHVLVGQKILNDLSARICTLPKEGKFDEDSILLAFSTLTPEIIKVIENSYKDREDSNFWNWFAYNHPKYEGLIVVTVYLDTQDPEYIKFKNKDNERKISK